MILPGFANRPPAAYRVVLAVLALCTFLSAAAPVIGAGGRSPSGVLSEAHGWIVVPVFETDSEGNPGARGVRSGGRHVLLHLPPREAALHGGMPGLGRRSRVLETEPEGIAASGRSVYLLYGNAPREDGASRYSVRTITLDFAATVVHVLAGFLEQDEYVVDGAATSA